MPMKIVTVAVRQIDLSQRIQRIEIELEPSRTANTQLNAMYTSI
jgi:hypothetical protein